MKRTKAMKLVAVCLAGALVATSVYTPVSAAKKTDKKVTITGKKKLTMKVGDKKKIQANQKVKWTVKGKSVKIIKGKNAKAVTVQAKKKGSATLTAQKGKKKASVKIQVTYKAAAQKNSNQTNTPQNNPAQVDTTDVTKLTDPSFYKVIKVNGNTLTLQAKDNKEYTTVVNANIPIWKGDAVVAASSVQVGEYFRCSPFSFKQGNETVITYAALVISEEEHQTVLDKQNNGNAEYTICAATFYVLEKDGDYYFDIAGSANGTKITTILIGEDTPVVVNGTKEYDGKLLTTGMRVMMKYQGDLLDQDLAWAYSIVAY